MMKNIFQKAAILLSSLTAACSPTSSTESPSTPTTFVWTNPLEYEYIDTDDSSLKKYTKVIDKNLKKNEKASPVFRLGNVMFFEIQKSSHALDASYQYRSAAVALPDIYFDMPSQSMFQTFSTAIRSNIDALESYVWIKAMIILATGNARYLQMPEDAPTWTEKDGNLEMIYYRLRSNGMAAETKEKCILTIDAAQKSTLACQDEVPPA
jgi:hypothetical protein